MKEYGEERRLGLGVQAREGTSLVLRGKQPQELGVGTHIIIPPGEGVEVELTSKGKTMDPYKVLGVRRSADKEEIKEAFRRLALRFHPDKHSSSPDHVKRAASLRFNQISDAYHFLLHHDQPPPDAPSSSSSSSSSRGGPHNSYSYGYARDARSHYKRSTGGSSYVKGGHGLSFHLLFQFLTSRSFLLNLAFASILFGGAVTVERCVDAVWKMQNAGKSFEEAIDSVEQVKKQSEKR